MCCVCLGVPPQKQEGRHAEESVCGRVYRGSAKLNCTLGLRKRQPLMCIRHTKNICLGTVFMDTSCQIVWRVTHAQHHV